MSSAGPNYPSTCAGWTNSSNAGADDGNYASTSMPASSDGGLLTCQNLGFAIPGGATIDGITVEIERKAQIPSTIKDVTVQLLDETGTGAGDNKADTGTYWPDSDGTASYGGAADAWSAGLSAADVNDVDFGVQVKPHN